MNPHALDVLELARVLDIVAERAFSPLGAACVRALRPTSDAAWVEEEQRRTTAMRALLEAEAGWTQEPIPDITTALSRLRIAGAAWSGRELLDAAVLLRSARRTRAALQDQRRPPVATAVLEPFARRLVLDAGSIESRIERAIDADGAVQDEASPLLRRLRRELRASQGELVKLLERIMARLEAHQAVPDMSVTVRNGRYVIPVRREGRSVVGGIVHDASATGATLFLEPPAAIEFGNRIREIEAEERAEVERVLAELTEELRPLAPDLGRALDALVALDALFARARFARDFRCEAVALGAAAAGFTIVDGRHPLLLAQRIAVVPFDLAMGPGERTLLVSGPNTGGKTVLLKAVGLLSVMMQCGVPVPVGAGTRLAVFDEVYADIGDEQSIEASLSTFSAHVKNLSAILREATGDSLVLVDELGSGTDPAEGAALGGAILEALTTRGTLTIATTHLGALKQLATEVPGVVNASLQFDAARLEPTFRLVKGIPGRSYGISIARRLALPEPVLQRAEERLPSGERDLAVLLAELERREEALAEREREAHEIAAAARDRAHKLAVCERSLRDRERALERESRSGARRYLLDARAEIERTIRELRAQGAEGLEQAARLARQHAERLAAEHGEAIATLDAAPPPRGEVAAAGPLAPGDLVEVETLGGKIGRVLDVREGAGIVAVGAVKVSVPLAALRRAPSGAEPPVATVALVGDLPEVHAPTEIDVRGLRSDEVESVVLQALDSAIRADLHGLRIIHGKGTGALRERVAEMLRKEVRVKSFRLGAWNEGGNGVTVVEL